MAVPQDGETNKAHVGFVYTLLPYNIFQYQHYHKHNNELHY